MSCDSSKLWTQLSDTLTAIRGLDDKEVDVKQMCHHWDQRVAEVKALVKDMKKWTKDEHKLEAELESVDRAIMKANTNIEKAEHKCSDVHKYIEKLSKKNDENKENVENVMSVWNTIGLRISKSDDVFDIKFNQISQTDPNKWFSVKVLIEDKHRIKVTDCDPKDSLDTQLVENEFNSRATADSKPDLRHLIAFMRSALKTSNAK